MYCKHCGKELPEKAKFCSECGSIVDEQEYNQEIELNHLFQSNDVQETEPSKTHKLFGFRSGKLWKKIVVIMYLVFIVIFFISALFVSDECDYTSTDRILTKISYLFIVVGFLLPYLWASDIFGFRMKLTKGKKIIAILVSWILFVVPMVSAIALDSAKSEEYKVACEQKAEIQKENDNGTYEIVISNNKGKSQENENSTKLISTSKKETTTAKSTTVDALHDNIVDSNEEIVLMLMSEDIAKAASNYPATTRILTDSWYFEQDGLKYSTCCTFECSNAYGVTETHLLAVVSEANSDGSKIKPIDVSLDGMAIKY